MLTIPRDGRTATKSEAVAGANWCLHVVAGVEYAGDEESVRPAE